MRRWRAEGFFSRARVDIRAVWQVVAAPWLFKREECWTRWKNSEVEGKRRLVWTCSPHFAWWAVVRDVDGDSICIAAPRPLSLASDCESEMASGLRG